MTFQQRTFLHRLGPALALLGALAVGAIGPRPAAAVEADRFLEAEREAAKGRLLVRIGKIDEGVAALERAHAISPDPRYRLEVGKAYEVAGRLPAAITAYERYLADGEGDERVYQAVRDHVAGLQARLAETHGEVLLTVAPAAEEVYLDAVAPGNRVDLPLRTWLPAGEHALLVQEPGFQPTKLSFSVVAGAPLQTVELALAPALDDGTLLVRANRRDATVFIDGREKCTAPCEQALQPGTYLVRVESPGDAPIQQLVRIRPGQTAAVDAMLRPSAGGAETPRIIPMDERPMDERPIAERPVERPTDERPIAERPAERPTDEPPVYVEDRDAPSGEGMSAMAIAGWSSLAVGVAAAGAGGYFTYAAFDKGDEANGLDPSAADYQDRFDALKGDVETNTTISMALYISGGALAATGATLLIIDALTDDGGTVTGRSDVVPFTAAPVPGGAMVNARFRF